MDLNHGPVERPRELVRARRDARRDARREKRSRRTVATEIGRWLGAALGVLACAVLALVATFYLAPHELGLRFNAYKADGRIAVPGLKAPLTLRRDARGVPYIFAETFLDALYGQGFAVAQDRLFQMELARLAAAGRLAEHAGARHLPTDRMTRAVGIRRLAEARAANLDEASTAELAAFAAGLNGFIRMRAQDLPQELALIGRDRPEPWTPADLLSIAYLQSWIFSLPMLDAELVAQGILERFDGDERIAEAFFPYVENPDEPGSGATRERRRAAARRPFEDLDLDLSASLWGEPRGGDRLGLSNAQNASSGSNNWAFSGARVGQTAAVVANDPHLDVRRLPGPWHPVGLFTADGVRAVGANVGLPGIFLGRTADVAFGVTVGYADTIDLYVETIDPERPGLFLDGAGRRSRWLEAERRVELIAVREGGVTLTERFEVLETPRGVILPDFGLVGRSDRALSLRWSIAAPEMAQRRGYRIEPLFRATDAREAVRAIEAFAEASLNFVTGDRFGAVARRATGFAPDRKRGDGLTPLPAAAAGAAWSGFVTGADLPGEIEPQGGWTGTANHSVATAEYGRSYSEMVSPAFRYRRMKALFDGDAPLSARLAAQAQRDVVNLLAVRLAPMFVAALEADPERGVETAEAARLLKGWDRRDEADAAAPLVFQEILRRAAVRLYTPSLGPELAEKMLKRREFWQERFAHVWPTAEGPVFEQAGVSDAAARDALLRQAAVDAMRRLERLHGSDTRLWRWGDAMKVRFQGIPPAAQGFEAAIRPFGHRLVEVSGSAETLDRAHFETLPADADDPIETIDSAASLRMVADLSDDEKVLAVMSGGVVGRSLHPHFDDQIDAWAGPGAPGYWWFSEEKILENTVSELRLTPAPASPPQ